MAQERIMVYFSTEPAAIGMSVILDFFDWYQRWSGLKDALKEHIHKQDRILILGCGLSKLSEDLYEDGYKQQINIDVSSVAIEQMITLYKKHPSMQFRVMDARDMKDFVSGSFDIALDKGTLDSILCGENSSANTVSMLQEVSRVLSSKGRFICITYGDPSYRITYLNRPEFNWSVQVKVVPKPTAATEVALAADDKDGVHYIYICTKNVAEDDAAPEQI